MHVLLIDATGVAGHGPVDDHGVTALARMARREGHRVSHLTLPVDAVELPRQWLSSRTAPDVVHVFAATARLPLLAHQLGLAQATVLTIVDLPPALDGRPVTDAMPALASATRCVVRSHHAARQWQVAAPAIASFVLPRGIDLLALMQAAHPSAQRVADAGGGGRRRTLVCCGPFDERSGVDTLLRAFAAVEGKDLRLRLLGSFDPGSSHGRSCSSLVAADARVSVEADAAGGSLAPTARDVDLVCVPQLDPLAFALAVHEGAALGVTCLVSDHGAQAEAVLNYGCGVCVAPGDVQAWTDAIAQWARHFAGRTPAASQARLPMRVEEEAFLYEGLYRQAMHDHQRDCALGA